MDDMPIIDDLVVLAAGVSSWLSRCKAVFIGWNVEKSCCASQMENLA